MRGDRPAARYRGTVLACYFGNFTQAVVVNLTPILFLPLRSLYGLSFTMLGILTLVNFLCQVVSDVVFSHAVDRFGYRAFTVAACILTLTGLTVFLLSPQIFPNAVFAGLLSGTVLFSVAGGLLEVLLSPIVNALPVSGAKDKAMSLMHSFYAWGQVVTVLATSLLVFFVSASRWQFIVLGWLAVPLVALVLFLTVPMPRPVAEEQRQTFRSHGRQSGFMIFVIIMIFAGASEQVLAQWTSTFLEAGLSLPKLLGDAVGVCSFAFMLGLGRLLFGKFGERFPLGKMMTGGAALTFLCYLIVALSPVAGVSVAFSALAGFGVSLLWPGTISLSTERYPRAGTWLFGLLACGGDLGAAAGPFFTGLISDGVAGLPFAPGMAEGLGLTPEQLGLRAGILCSAVFPLVCFLLLAATLLKKKKIGIGG